MKNTLRLFAVSICLAFLGFLGGCVHSHDHGEPVKVEQTEKSIETETRDTGTGTMRKEVQMEHRESREVIK